ncbi:MAG: hypothetical protein ACI4CE_07455 [Methanomethylophilus alvi]
MSAYMVPNEDLCKIAGYITAILDGTEHTGTCEGVKAFWFSQDFKQTFKEIPGAYDSKCGCYNAKPIHCALYVMNRQALMARYGECADAYEGFDGKAVETREDTRNEWQCRLFSVIRNFLYQCNEGRVPEIRLFKAIRELETTLAYTIAAETAKRDWGCGWSGWRPEVKGERESQMRD